MTKLLSHLSFQFSCLLLSFLEYINHFPPHPLSYHESSHDRNDSLTLSRISSNNFNIPENLTIKSFSTALQYFYIDLGTPFNHLQVFLKKYYCTSKNAYYTFEEYDISEFLPLCHLSSILSMFTPTVFCISSATEEFFLCSFLSFYRAFPLMYDLTLLPHFILWKYVSSIVPQKHFYKKIFSVVPHMSRPFSFSDPAEILCTHNVCFGQSTGPVFSFLILTMFSNYCSVLQSATHSPSALLQDNIEQTPRFPFVPYQPNSSFTAALPIFPFC